MNSFKALFPFLQWPRLTPALFRQEWTAGFSVALLMVPQSVAYAALAGMPLVTGLYAALLPALIGVMWGGSTRLSIGPSALTCILISASLTGMAQPSSGHWVHLAIWLALMAGTLQLMMGVFRYGWLLNLISSPVMMGFTQAAGLLIMASQLPALTGWQSGGSFLWTDVAFGAASLAALFLAKKWAPKWPSIMLVVAVSAAVSYAMGYAANGGSVIGALPSDLPSLSLPNLPSLEELGFLVGPAVLIALVSFLEAASCAKTENQKEGTVWQENQDLIGQGLAKIVSGLSGSFATSTSFSRSAINLAAGAQTGWAVVGTTSFVLLAVFAAPALFHVPRAVLAAIVILAVSSLIQPMAFVKLWRMARMEAVTAGLTFGITLLSAPRIYWGFWQAFCLASVIFCTPDCILASLKWACTKTAVCAIVTCGTYRPWHPMCLPFEWMQNLTLLPPAALKNASRSNSVSKRKFNMCACLRNPSTALMPPALKHCSNFANTSLEAAYSCTSAASSYP